MGPVCRRPCGGAACGNPRRRQEQCHRCRQAACEGGDMRAQRQRSREDPKDEIGRHYPRRSTTPWLLLAGMPSSVS